MRDSDIRSSGQNPVYFFLTNEVYITSSGITGEAEADVTAALVETAGVRRLNVSGCAFNTEASYVINLDTVDAASVSDSLFASSAAANGALQCSFSSLHTTNSILCSDGAVLMACETCSFSGQYSSCAVVSPGE